MMGFEGRECVYILVCTGDSRLDRTIRLHAVVSAVYSPIYFTTATVVNNGDYSM